MLVTIVPRVFAHVPLARPFAVSLAIVLASTLATQGSALARPRSAECKASGPPGRVEAQAPFKVAASLAYDGDQWLVLLDKNVSPKHVRLVSSSGRVLDLARPPRFTPTAWFGRGKVIYGLGSGRSLEAGKVNIVLVRWALDGRRPRVVRLWTEAGIGAGPSASLVGDELAVGWAAPAGKPRAGRTAGQAWNVGFANLERMAIGDPLAIGRPARQVWGQMLAHGKGARALWIEDGKVMTADLDGRGAVTRKPAPLGWPGKPKRATAVQCGEHLYALDQDASGQARLLRVDGEAANPLTGFDALGMAEMSLACAGEAAVVGHRVFNDKAGSVVFWISTVDASGKVRARRVRDIRGEKDDLRAPVLAGSGTDMSAFWTQKNGSQTDLYTRRIGCR